MNLSLTPANKEVRILIIINRFVIGGQAADTIPLLFKLKDKYKIKIICGQKEADEIEPLYLLQQYPGLDIQKIPSLRRSVNPLVDLQTLFKLYKNIKTFQPHIVHTHGAKSGLLGRLATWFWGKGIIVHTFHGHLFHSYFNSFLTRSIIFLERILARLTHAAIALSPSQKKELTEEFRIFPAEKVFEIPLGIVDPQENFQPKTNLRQQFKIAEDEVAIAIIGRIVPIKNHFDFLKIALSVLDSEIKKVRFFIIGDGNERLQLENFLREQNQSFSTSDGIVDDSKFIFTSWIADMYSAVEEMDIVVLTSSNEGTPVSLIEAQLSSKPVVAYNVGGVRDTFVNGISGFLIEKGNIQNFADRLIQLINEKSLRQQMGQKGREYSLEKYSKAAEVSAIENLYTLLLNRHQKS